MSKPIRLTLDLTGILQGVGFRPTIARAVSNAGLTGWVRNQSGSVRLSLCGNESKVEAFVLSLSKVLPPHARLETVRRISKEALKNPESSNAFVILDSHDADLFRISIPADLATCESCRDDLFNADSRYFEYPFITCTNCGPRYTVVENMPYDRDNTSLKDFPLCEDCRDEYTDMFSRRFHAESIACAVCGPSLKLVDVAGRLVEGDAIANSVHALKRGDVLAIKGLGGYHLALEPFNIDAVHRMRERKNRPAKPFAVMVKDVAAARKYCVVSDQESMLLQGSKGPIVVLDLLPGFRDEPVFEALAPFNNTLGVMLPTTPLHHLLFAQGEFEMLVMTSGNPAGEPICISNDTARVKLGGIADLFLQHDRKINYRCDDSLVRHAAGRLQVLRRARGFAPNAIRLGRPLDGKYLAMGADLKNTVALGFNDDIVISPHLGNLESVEAVRGMAQVVDNLPGYYRQQPEQVLVDLHPDMQSSRKGIQYAEMNGIAVRKVQHHHAHAAACMGEYNLVDALALVFDGTGLGTDGTIWGGELLHVFPGNFVRMGYFSPVPLPGGDFAVRNPVRQLAGRWQSLGADIPEAWLAQVGVRPEEFRIWRTQCKRGVNAPLTSAVGRLFDAFSVLLGVSPPSISFEGQGPMWLEAVAECSATKEMNFDGCIAYESKQSEQEIVVDFEKTFLQLADKPVAKGDVADYARAFHLAIAAAAVQMAEYGRERTGCKRIVLSGGVMMNRMLVGLLNAQLSEKKFDVYVPSLVPSNDGGISFGQIYAMGGKN